MRKLVEGVAEIFTLNCEIKGIRMITEIDPSVPLFIYTDPNRVRQVLLNLVSNAVKFTFEGLITISLVCLGLENNSEDILEESNVNSVGVLDTMDH